MSKTIKIGTRDSELALWQAKIVQNLLETAGHTTVLVPIKSTGDLVLDKPLYELGITGVFTRTLDIAMLNHDIDIAVHSLKDVPTILPNGKWARCRSRKFTHADFANPPRDPCCVAKWFSEIFWTAPMAG